MKIPLLGKVRSTISEALSKKDAEGDAQSRGLPFLMLACTALVIASQFLAAEFAARKFQAALRQNEYEKVWGEANYLLLQEIQRDRSAAYIKDLEEKEPEYVRELRKKIERTERALEAASTMRGKLTRDEISALEAGTPSVSGSGSPVRVVEFSDFTCPYCKGYRNSKALERVLESRSGSVAYSFKAMPNKKHEGADRAARLVKCVESKYGPEAYFRAVDAVFSSTGSAADAAKAEILRLGMSEAEASACAESPEISAKVEKDFGQGVYFKIRATPSTLILNAKTGEYAVLVGERDLAELEKEIDALAPAEKPE